MGGWTTLDEGKWNDADCSSPARFFCEKSQKDPSRGKTVILPAGELVVHLKSTSLSRRGGLIMQLGMKQMYSGQPKSGPPFWGLAKG